MKRMYTIMAIVLCFGLSLFFGWIACGSSNNGDPNDPYDPNVPIEQKCQTALGEAEACAALLGEEIPPDVEAQILEVCETPPVGLESGRDCLLNCAAQHTAATYLDCLALYGCACGEGQCNLGQYSQFTEYCSY